MSGHPTARSNRGASNHREITVCGSPSNFLRPEKPSVSSPEVVNHGTTGVPMSVGGGSGDRRDGWVS